MSFFSLVEICFKAPVVSKITVDSTFDDVPNAEFPIPISAFNSTDPMAAAKRPRASSSSSSSLATNQELPQTTTTEPPPPHKASRIHPSESKNPLSTTTTTIVDNSNQPHTILCNLPPTCQNRPTPIQSTIELERHYAKFHAHVCEVNNCGCVFPEERFLELVSMHIFLPFSFFLTTFSFFESI